MGLAVFTRLNCSTTASCSVECYIAVDALLLATATQLRCMRACCCCMCTEPGTHLLQDQHTPQVRALCALHEYVKGHRHQLRVVLQVQSGAAQHRCQQTDPGILLRHELCLAAVGSIVASAAWCWWTQGQISIGSCWHMTKVVAAQERCILAIS